MSVHRLLQRLQRHREMSVVFRDTSHSHTPQGDSAALGGTRLEGVQQAVWLPDGVWRASDDFGGALLPEVQTPVTDTHETRMQAISRKDVDLGAANERMSGDLVRRPVARNERRQIVNHEREEEGGLLQRVMRRLRGKPTAERVERADSLRMAEATRVLQRQQLGNGSGAGETGIGRAMDVRPAEILGAGNVERVHRSDELKALPMATPRPVDEVFRDADVRPVTQEPFPPKATREPIVHRKLTTGKDPLEKDWGRLEKIRALHRKIENSGGEYRRVTMAGELIEQETEEPVVERRETVALPAAPPPRRSREAVMRRLERGKTVQRGGGDDDEATAPTASDDAVDVDSTDSNAMDVPQTGLDTSGLSEIAPGGESSGDTGSDGDSQVGGSLTVGGNFSGGNLTVGGDVTVAGAMVASGSTSVGGDVSAGGAASMSGVTTIGGDLESGAVVSASGTTTVGGDVSSGAALSATGPATIDGSVESGASTSLAGPTTVGSDLTSAGAVAAAGATTVSGDVQAGVMKASGATNVGANLSVGGSATFSGGTSVGGNVTVGGSATGLPEGGTGAAQRTVQRSPETGERDDDVVESVPLPRLPTQPTQIARRAEERVADAGRVPLEAAWPVQRKGDFGDVAQASENLIVQRSPERSSADFSSTGHETVRPVRRETLVDQQVRRRLELVKGGRDSDSAIPFVSPRRPRPVLRRVEDTARRDAEVRRLAEDGVKANGDSHRKVLETNGAGGAVVQRTVDVADAGTTRQMGGLVPGKPGDSGPVEGSKTMSATAMEPAGIRRETTGMRKIEHSDSPGRASEMKATGSEPPKRHVNGSRDAGARLVETEIGALPADLWRMIGEEPPADVGGADTVEQNKLNGHDASEVVGSVQRAVEGESQTRAQGTSPSDVDEQAGSTLAGGEPNLAQTKTVQREALGRGRAERVEPEGGGADDEGGDVDTDELARQVYARLKRRLAVEWEREFRR